MLSREPTNRYRTRARRSITLVGAISLLAAWLPGAASARAPLPAGGRVIAPSQRPRGGFAVSADGRTVAYAEALSCGRALCAHYPTFVWRDGRVVRIDDSTFRALTAGGVALSGDGRLAAYPASYHGRPGTVLYDLAHRRSRFVAGFVIAPADAPYHAMSDTGRYLLGFRGPSSQVPGVYDARTGAFTPLPKPPKPFLAIPEFLSGAGRYVLLTDSTNLKGGVAQTVLYSLATRRSTALTSSDPHHSAAAFGLGLSADGAIALVAGAPRNSPTTSQATLFDRLDNSFLPLFTDPNSFLFGAAWSSVSLTADGQTLAFVCHDSFYLYNPASGEISVVLADFYHGRDTVTGSITGDGNAIVFESGALPGTPQARDHGLFEVPTAQARLIGTTFPVACQTAE